MAKGAAQRVAKRSVGSRGSASGASAPAPRLLSGGNPQVPKGDGDGPVRAYIEAMPGWKRDVGRRLDAMIVAAVPGVRKAVRWNAPFYGAADGSMGWFLSMHCVTRYVKVAFFRGDSLEPRPPVGSKKAGVRYWHIHEGDAIDEAVVTGWIRQAAGMEGEHCF
ncbi:MAG: DUF1801 domain-containing protein [Phycisphaeraceae bacterium]|nr:DUF1801 domain-containing protein [Phycisphaeraceae bacterium]